MHRGTAISAPFAFAHFLFLPVTYSMIFHRGVPNFSYAQQGADDNVNALRVEDRSTVIIDLVESKDNSWTPDSNGSELSSPVTFSVVEDYNVSTPWGVGSTTATMDVGADEEVSTYSPAMNTEVVEDYVSTSWVVDNSNITSYTASNINLSLNNSAENQSIVGDYNVSSLWIASSSTVNMDIVGDDNVSTIFTVDCSTVIIDVDKDNNVSTPWISNSSNITMESASDDSNVSVNSSTGNGNVVQDENFNTIWITGSSTAVTEDIEDSYDMTINAASDNIVNESTVNTVINVGDKDNDSMQWTEEILTEITGDFEEINVSTSRIGDMTADYYSFSVYSSTENADVVEDDNISTIWNEGSSTVAVDDVEGDNVSTSWIADSSNLTAEVVSDSSITVNGTTVNIAVVENSLNLWTSGSQWTALLDNDNTLTIEDSSTVTSDTVEVSRSSTPVYSSNLNTEASSESNASMNGSAENVEVGEGMDLWTPNSKWTALPDSYSALSIEESSTVITDILEESSFGTPWIVDSSNITVEAPANIDVSVYIPTLNVEVDKDVNVSALWNVDGTAVTINFIEDHNISALETVNSSVVQTDDVDEDWNGTCRHGKMQSPIHITTVTAEVNPDAQPIIFVNYDLASLEAVVTSHTIKFDVKPHFSGYQIGIAGGGLMGFYELNHIHLHWSSSEHSIDNYASSTGGERFRCKDIIIRPSGEYSPDGLMMMSLHRKRSPPVLDLLDTTDHPIRYKMEAHLVHFKSLHGNLTEDEVLDEPDGIAVLAVLFELGSADPIIEDLILNLGRNQTQAEMPKVMPKSFLPDNTDEYIRYRGSLTTPPCSEVVIWTIFPTPKSLTQYQVKWLSTRKLSEGIPDPFNYRPTQNRNDRAVVLMKASYTINIIPSGDPERGNAVHGAPCIALVLAAVISISFSS